MGPSSLSFLLLHANLIFVQDLRITSKHGLITDVRMQCDSTDLELQSNLEKLKISLIDDKYQTLPRTLVQDWDAQQLEVISWLQKAM